MRTEAILAIDSEVQAAKEKVRRARAAAINLMEDALAARRKAEEAERAMRDSEQRLRIALQSAAMGMWDWDIVEGRGRVTPENQRLFGLPEDVLEPATDDYSSLIHPDDAERVTQAFVRAAETGCRYDIEYRIRRPDGIERWIHSEGQRIEMPEGRSHFIGISRDITRRKLAEEALASAKAAAEAANVAKSQFLANMSHELRTPMNAILGMIDVALPKATDPMVLDCLQTAKGSADLLLTLLNDLLDSAKIESGKLELESAPFNPRQMLDHVSRVLSVRASEKGLRFSCRVPDDTPPAVKGDRVRLQQVLLNLAGNAIKFTEKGEVEITLRVGQAETGDREPSSTAVLQFTVRDTGIGIPASRLERIFEPFAQADASTTRRFGGTGLGLSISRSIVEMMGGTMRVESEVGKGSRFSFDIRLPLAERLPADFDAPVVVSHATRAQLRILLVEDNPANQKLATYILEDRGHLVDIAGDGQEAVYWTEKNHYDVILMDVQMPGMDGLEATAAVRKREGGKPRVPIIAMTAHAMKGDRERCLAAGMDGYLSKPVKAQEMIALVERLAGMNVPDSQLGTTEPKPEATPEGPPAVFDEQEALARCCDDPEVLKEMIEDFACEVDELFPQMRSALARGDLKGVGRLGHRMKGTVVYLGAWYAKEAAMGVEQFSKSDEGTVSEAEQAVNVLERECLRLKAVLQGHRAEEPKRRC